MHGIGYFQNLRIFLRNCLEFFWIFLGIFGKLLRGFFGRNLLGEIFWEYLLGRIFLGGIFWRHYVENNKELMFLPRFWDNFVSMEKEVFLILRSATQAHRT